MKIFIKQLIFFLIPFYIVIGLYITKDPFKVIYRYESYYRDNSINPIYLNKDHVSTQNLLNHSSVNTYNSFILGNSKTVFLDANRWGMIINECENNCYHFDASAETILGIRNKIMFLDNNNFKLKNILISLDFSTLRKDYIGDRQLNINSYLNTQEVNPIFFHYVHAKTFLNGKFLFPYLYYLMSNEQLSEFMYKFRIFDEKKIHYNKITNEIRYPEIDSLISNQSYFTSSKLSELPDNNESVAPSVIAKSQKKLLKDIRMILKKHNSSYVIIIPPSYDKIKLSSEDMKVLKSIFSSEHVYDFSGKNTITLNKEFYYEQTHFIPKVWNIIIDSVYHQTKLKPSINNP